MNAVLRAKLPQRVKEDRKTGEAGETPETCPGKIVLLNKTGRGSAFRGVTAFILPRDV